MRGILIFFAIYFCVFAFFKLPGQAMAGYCVENPGWPDLDCGINVNTGFLECISDGVCCVLAGNCGVSPGGGGSCKQPRASCPAGFVRGNILQSSSCASPTYCPGLGSAQVSNSSVCCSGTGGNTECGDFYDCPTPSNANKVCRDCVEIPWECSWNQVDTYNCVQNCVSTSPSAPTLTAPANGTQVRVGTIVNLTWTHDGSWGTSCSGQNNNFFVCSGYEGTNCTYVGAWNGTATSYAWTPTVADSTVEWAVAANNGTLEAGSARSNLCVEGFNVANTAYVSNWSSCDTLTHKRTRTCTENCGTDDCAGVSLQEDCMGVVRGTLFDASTMSSCPSFDPVTGYLIGVDTSLSPSNRTFGFTDAVTSGGTHPWAPLSTVRTGFTGNYNLSVYAPTTYNYDFSTLSDMYIVSSGPKLTCTSASAVVPDNSVLCGTQPCSLVYNMSFGFNKSWGGWWQVVGASVHGEDGIKSSIPNNLETEQSLILPDASTGNRRGVLSYATWLTEMLGTNTDAMVSNSLWQVNSSYEGVIYDYDYFNQLLKKYPSVTWNGVSGITYDDGGNGYEIVKVAGSVANFTFNPTGTQKIIFLVDGSVTVGSNLVIPVGAYMAVIASGDISFATNVTRADGWFLADNIYVRCIDANVDSVCDKTDSQFLGNGSFVGWDGVYLGRDRGGAANITGPAEKFTYRLDLHTNAPEQLKNVTKTYKPYVP